MQLYAEAAYAETLPPPVAEKLEQVRNAGSGEIPTGILEKNDVHAQGWAIRMGQPHYPHAKLAIDPMPDGEYVFRVDAHDRHLHAPPGSSDEAWLAGIRKSNQELVEKVEAAWEAAGVPTFRGMLRRQVAERKARH